MKAMPAPSCACRTRRRTSFTGRSNELVRDGVADYSLIPQGIADEPPELLRHPVAPLPQPPRLLPPRRRRFRHARPGRLARPATTARRGTGRPEPQPARAAPQPLPGEGQVRHLAVHERRAEPGRYL